jgi:alpha-L-rhamnosidase
MNLSIHRRKAPLLLLRPFFLWAAFPITGNAQNNVNLIKLRCNNADNPLGIDATTPQFSWEFSTDTRNFRQAAYQVVVADSP